MSFVKNSATPLLKLSPSDFFSVENSYGGVHGFGGIGSGKTSGLGKTLAAAYLRAGFGGVVTAVKPAEIPLWKNYCASNGRAPSLVLFDENEGFNFLTYELNRQGVDGIGTVTECLMRVLEAARRASGTATQRGGEAFWEDSSRKILRYTILPLYAANGEVSISDIIRFITTAPTNPTDPTSAEWQKRSFMYEVMDRATRRPRVPLPRQTMKDNLDFWAEEYPAQDARTRSNVTMTVTATLDRFKHGRLRRAFCEKTTIVPELTFHGAVVLLAMPTLLWNEDGIIAQQIFKYMWQRSVLGRNSLEEKHRSRPLFLWSDEAQETVSSYDGEFLGMCRDANCSVNYLTQSLPNYFSKMGGDNSRDTAYSLVGKFKTQVFHANGCPETNEYASRVIGKTITRRGNFNAGTSRNVNFGMSAGENENYGSNSSYGSSGSSSGGSGSSGSHGSSSSSGSSSGRGNNWGSNKGEGRGETESRGYSESMENIFEPGDFARILKTGGAANKKLVTAVWFQNGRIFEASGQNVMVETFRQ
jgi:uncharacterized membrane protein YgcG